MKRNISLRTSSVTFLLDRTLFRLRHALHARFREAGIKLSIEQWLVLQQLDEKGISQRDIAELTAKDPASVTRILSGLEKRKMLKRFADKNDQRRVLVVILPAGKNILREADKAVEQYRGKGMKGIDHSELNALKKTLDKLFENAGGRLETGI